MTDDKNYRTSINDFTDDELRALVAAEDQRQRDLRVFGGNQKALDAYKPGLARLHSNEQAPQKKTRSSGERKKTMPPAKKNVHVHGHTMRTASGKVVRRKGHTRTTETWKQAGVAWAGAAGSGAITLALVVELGFAVISAVCMILTAVLGTLAVILSQKASKPRRRMRAKTRRPAARTRTRTRTGTRTRKRTTARRRMW